MAKNELDLDEELNNSLDFLDDHDLNLTQNNGTLSPKQSFNLNFNKTKLITVITIISIIILIIIMHTKKKTTHTMLTTVTEQSINKPPAPSVPVVPPKPQPTATAIPNNNTNNNLTWQDLKKTVEETSTHIPTPELPVAPTHVPTVSGFEHSAPQPIQAIPPISTVKEDHTQESIKELKTTIENITNDLTANVNQIKELQNNLKEISKSISNVNSSINSVDSKILNLTTTVDTLSGNIKKYTQDEDLDLTANLKPSEQDLFSNSNNTPEYLIHAVIPGRAWLKSSSGQIITVAEGDALGDYGKIALIDTANNLVRTSSGVVFR